MAKTTEQLAKENEALQAQIAALKARSAGGKDGPRRVISINAGGGLFVRDPSFEETSSRSGGTYIANANIPWGVARRLFVDDELLAQTRAYVRHMADDPNAYVAALESAVDKKEKRELEKSRRAA